MSEHAPVAFIDTETTGLHPDEHEIWEIGLVYADGRGGWGEWEVQLPVHLNRADTKALEIGQFWDRYTNKDYYRTPDIYLPRIDEALEKLMMLTRGLHLVGAVPSFDEERLRRLMWSRGFMPLWHYHLVDVESLVAGRFRIQPPWNSEELSKVAGFDRENLTEDEQRHFLKHSAIGDARWAQRLYELVFDIP